MPSLSKRLAAEFTGTALLMATVVGSGIMADRPAENDVAIAYIASTSPRESVPDALFVALATRSH
jgi:hypothetical protein